MKTDRKEGILYFDTLKPYKVAIAGKLEERTEIICHDVNAKCEEAALDMEQLLLRALNSLPERTSRASKKQMDADEKKDKSFFDNNSPSEKEIDEQATNLSLIVQMNSAVQMSQLLEVFQEILASGVISYVGNQKMTSTVWTSIGRKDKTRIMFRYCSFFVNPLEQLANMVSSKESQES